MAETPPTVGERVGDIVVLDYYRKVRRSVCRRDGSRCLPAAVVMRMQAHDVHRMFCDGLYSYVPQRSRKAFPNPRQEK